ncbi:ANTAR domain-containing response regulator [Rhizobium halophytocola]|uniref:AmiR/NasT family two-component response regulator n=1 Tax=Rhizobium halophytocola TaxID=735519 RepID=A0ABS4DU06_9HYPH|nr:ANTAR domain-containing protein [Rhizobium halophytocola]MBP1849179.1 AmiR/NasT family two-component response regulator [Rhizobium halophytocola]
MSRPRRPSLAGWQAIILHRPHPAVEALRRQLEALQITVRDVWPQVSPTDATADVVFFDADMGHDDQFPWPAGHAPMPLIAMIGSEAPGRVEWALGQGSNAHLLKPIGSTGAYSALLIAAHAFEGARAQQDDIRSLEVRLRQRPVVVRAVVKLMHEQGDDETAAMRQLRSFAMAWRMTIEEAAEAVCSNDQRARKGA